MPASAWGWRDEGGDPGRRPGHPPLSPDPGHQQAPASGGHRADDLPRHPPAHRRRDGGDPGGDQHRPHGRRGALPGQRQGVRVQPELQGAGGGARDRPRPRPDRGLRARRSGLRHPRRQHLRVLHPPLRRCLPAPGPRGPRPAQGGGGPGALRRGGPGRAPGDRDRGEAEQPQIPLCRGGALLLRRPGVRHHPRDRTLRAGRVRDHRGQQRLHRARPARLQHLQGALDRRRHLRVAVRGQPHPAGERQPHPGAPVSGGREEFLVFGAPQIGEAEIAEVVEVLRSRWLGTGPRVARFEREFARYEGVAPERAAAVNSCTAALHLSLLACDLSPGDEVITTPLTFCATVNAIIHAGATPVLADVDPVTMNLDPAAVEAAITPRTRALVPVHFAGRPCDMEALTTIARRHGLKLVEDCAHAIETRWRGQAAGTFGDFGCFSFYVTKNLVTGEGGMVLGRDPEAMDRIRRLALHGMSQDAWKRFSDEGYRHYQVVECGYKYNLTDLAAAIGLHQLERLEANWERRREIWRRYQEAFGDLPLVLPAEPEPDTRHAFHLYTVLVDPERCGMTRDAFLGALHERRIGTGVHYLSIPEHPCYRERFGWRPEAWPNALRIGRQTASLPLSAALGDADVADVIHAVRTVLG
ncbi:MAG: aminotransferase class I/II-fold pyridoxal phosphate-dependent enzyme [Gammaproteobacteria bacterium]|nr:MAG: aminotransferase class I/II-fold pyridoxal phosphate-dependent enzyme [Gammaproteobacteria bacterium]